MTEPVAFVRPSGSVIAASTTPVSAEVLLLGSALAASPAHVRAVLPHVQADDFDDLGAAEAWGVMTPLVASGREFHAAAVQAELLRQGKVDGLAKKAMLDAVTAGCSGLEPELRMHAELVVALAFRRRFKSWGAALTAGAGELAECDLMPLAVRAGLAAREHSIRLGALRGEEVAA
ncbi:DnaB-like helicase N-terminal domain-containing protein [Rhodococcus sp. Q]|uniref:DnaB-like helicase N-terminal domain-containing protein n=1 Tax=Rhodococcus sp. Q TaxID=2502252 RepID=UPI0010F48458|nr:DnaB-like helicase N-terminal domain-containing protein [Rhodococcus sp. Q]